MDRPQPVWMLVAYVGNACFITWLFVCTICVPWSRPLIMRAVARLSILSHLLVFLRRTVWCLRTLRLDAMMMQPDDLFASGHHRAWSEWRLGGDFKPLFKVVETIIMMGVMISHFIQCVRNRELHEERSEIWQSIRRYTLCNIHCIIYTGSVSWLYAEED